MTFRLVGDDQMIEQLVGAGIMFVGIIFGFALGHVKSIVEEDNNADH
mgnify:CR=1 FL=1